MADIVVTVPQDFRHPCSPHRGLLAWADEGTLPGDDLHMDECPEYVFSTGGMKPDIKPGERVYIVCEGRLRGYAPLVNLEFVPERGNWGHVYLTRAGGAVAVTIPRPIIGFRGWRYRWWPREEEVPFPDWLANARCRCEACRNAAKGMPLFAKPRKRA